MTVSVKDSGTQVAVISTEHTLATITDAGTYVLVIDPVNMADGDIVEFAIQRKVLTGGTIRDGYRREYAHQQNEQIYSIPVPMPFGGVFLLKQTAGTGRSFDWSVEEL